MIPPTMLVPHEDLQYPTQTSPDLRRMEMFNRAHRDQKNEMGFEINGREPATTVSIRESEDDSSAVSRFVNSIRNGIGNALVTAGNRIQSPA